MNKNITIIIVIAVLIIGGGLIWYWMNSSAKPLTMNTNTTTTNTSTKNNTTTAPGQNQNQVKGTMYFSIADAAINMAAVSAVNITIDKLQVYNGGWITVSQTPQTFNLLALKSKGQAVLLGKISVPQGTYSDFKLHIAKVMVTSGGVTKQALMPSGDFEIKADVLLNPNTSSAAQFDVLADKSLHQTDKGEFVFAPVIRFDRRSNATVQVGAGNVMSVSFGETSASVTLGMDVDGKIKPDFAVDANAKLDVTGGVIKVLPSLIY